MAAWMLWCVLVCALSCLMSSMSKHQRDIFTLKVKPSHTRTLQFSGWLLVGLAAVAAIFYYGASIGIAVWLGCITFAAFLVGLTASYFAKYVVPINLAVAALFALLVLYKLYVLI